MKPDDIVVQDQHLVDGIFVKEFRPARGSGTATPLLFVHGAMHGWWAWEPGLPLFAAAGWRSYALSLRNHTGSHSVPDNDYLSLDALAYVDDVNAVMRWLGRRPVLIGHSMGSLIAQKAAERQASAAMILICGLGPGQLGRLRDPLPLDKPVMRPKEDIGRAFFNQISPTELSRYYDRLTPESPGVINRCNDGTLSVDRSRIEGPTLVVSGGSDKIPLHAGAEIARFYDAQLLTVPDGSHNFFMEAPALPVANRVIQWLFRHVEAPNAPEPTDP